MPRDDVAFGYDPRPFMKGLGVVTKGLGDLTKKVTGIAGQITRRFLLVGAAIKAGQALIKQFNKYVPEVGRAFSTAGSIFFKNFFWPIRKMLMPMLQDMLDWVRDHRTLFVKWGAVLANIFRSIVGLGRQLLGVFRSIIDSVGPAFKRLFGGSFQDFLNIVTVKMAVALEFMGRLMKTIFGNLGTYLPEIVDNIKRFATAIWDLVSGFLTANTEGKSLWTVLEKISEFAGKALVFVTGLVAAFGEGFAESMKEAATPLTGIATALSGILDALIGLEGKTGVLGDIANLLGKMVGSVIMAGLKAVWISLLGIQSALEVLPLLFTSIGAVGDAEKLAKVQKEMDELHEKQKARFDPVWKSFTEVPEKEAKDAIITKRGEVIRLDPNDTIMAARDPGRFGGGSMDIDITLNVTEGDARNAGAEFAGGLEERFRRFFLDAQTAGGR